nr:hypothetical protein [Sinorhizobium meliloti]
MAVARSIKDRDERVRLILHEQIKGHIATYNDGLDGDDAGRAYPCRRTAGCRAIRRSGLRRRFFSGGLPARRTVGRTWIIWSGVDWLRDRCRTGYNVVASPEVAMRTLVLRTIGGDRADLPHAGAVEMCLRTSAVSEIGFLVGVDRRNSRHHAVNMNKRDFSQAPYTANLST